MVDRPLGRREKREEKKGDSKDDIIQDIPDSTRMQSVLLVGPSYVLSVTLHIRKINIEYVKNESASLTEGKRLSKMAFTKRVQRHSRTHRPRTSAGNINNRRK